jgi:circadian clock protein KaiC
MTSRLGARASTLPKGIAKAPTGIAGLDDLTGGGLPRGRPTLVCGGAGSGKTLFGVEFLVRGAVRYDEPGVAVLFEETAEELAANVASLGFDVPALVAKKRLIVDHVHIERSEIQETGDYNLDGLFVRLEYAVKTVGAKRVLLDTMESLFSGLSNAAILRAELRRLFGWLKERGLTVVITGERGDGVLTRHGLEEYVSDCVIGLDNRMEGQIATRRLRIVKYRGTNHGTNEYPFLIDEQGISVLPITSLGLAHAGSSERISTGIAGLDEMMGGMGCFRGSSILISGGAGSGKTSVAANLVAAACQRGERCLYFAFEESPGQLVRNMRSIGLDLEPWHKQGLLRIVANRPSLFGLEMHLVATHKTIDEFLPQVVVLDPITDLMAIGNELTVHSMLTRLIDYQKFKSITAVLTSLTAGGDAAADSEVSISSLIDTWIVVQQFEVAGERNRGLSIVKSRGMAHSNAIREFVLSDQGIRLVDVYRGSDRILTGSARLARERQDQDDARLRRRETDRKRAALERRRRAVASQVEALHAELQAEEEALGRLGERDEEMSRSAGGKEGAASDGGKLRTGRARKTPTP